MEKQFKNNYKVIYGDTDSLVYKIIHPDIYEWIKENKQCFDLSEYKREDMKDYTNQKKFGCFTDELNGMVLSEMLGLNPKYYGFKYKNTERIKKVEDKLITLNNYKNTSEINKSSINLQILVLLIYLHSYQTTEKKKAKGVSKACVAKLINFNDYNNTLETHKSAIRDVVSIRSFNQQLFTYKQEHIALISFYEKMKNVR
jgi:hypothetical protein